MYQRQTTTATRTTTTKTNTQNNNNKLIATTTTTTTTTWWWWWWIIGEEEDDYLLSLTMKNTEDDLQKISLTVKMEWWECMHACMNDVDHEWMIQDEDKSSLID